MILRHPLPAVSDPRRGVLLLVTVSMLTLFMMLGTAYLIVATRARESARALARRTLTADEARIDPASLLDNVLLTVVRGTAGGQPLPTFNGTALNPPFESLLADRYGTTPITGAVTSPQIYSAAGAGNTGPVVTGTFTLATGSVSHPAQLNGRILTFTAAGRPPTSHRILQASRAADGSPFSLTLANPPGPYQLKAGGLPTGTAIINGREFAGASGNEAWDGFDNENAFLARVIPNGVSRSTVVRPTYVSSLAGDLADNDNDGVPDGVFLNFGLPSIPISSGTSVVLDASVLIVDLDGRFNVNAHGSLANVPLLNSAQTTLYPPSASGWTSETTDDLARLADVPLGSGIGLAEVNAGHLFSANAFAAMNANERPRSGEEPGAGLLCGLGAPQAGKRPSGSRFSSGEDTVRVASIEGRHGGKAAPAQGFWSNLIPPLRNASMKWAALESARLAPASDMQKTSTVNNGVPPLWWLVLPGQGNSFNWGSSSNNRPLPRAIYNSPPDLHGRMKTLTRPVRRETTDTDGDGRVTYGIAPCVSFAKPEWSTNSNNDAETENSPYETRLRSAGSRGGYVHAPTTDGSTDSPMPTNPFTLAELERLLRPYDIDTNQLPPRLVALLGTVGEQMRTRLTSESWDTTAIVDGRAEGAWGRISASVATLSGTSANAIYGTSPVTGVLGGEVARGERFNLNRVLSGVKPAAYSASDPYYIQRQAYFKDLYTLAVLLDDAPSSLTADEKAELAQWAANVVDFRDADSTMTPFEYDTDIFDGWDVDGNLATTGDADRGVVYGAERPEALLTHTLAWESDSGGELFIGIHRPWHTYAHASGSTKIPAEPIDMLLDATGQPQNVLDLGRKSGNAAYPIWRLRIVAGGVTKYVRFDEETAAANEFANSGVTSAAATPKLGTDSWLCVRSNTNSLFGGAAPWLTLPPVSRMQQFTIDVGGVFKAPGAMEAAAPTTWPSPRKGVVYLERLADPESQPTNSIWAAEDPKTATDLVRYVVVDQAPLQIVRRSPPVGTTIADYNASSVTLNRIPRLLLRRTKNETAFWKTDDVDRTEPTPTEPNPYNHLTPVAWFDGTRGELLTMPLLEEGSASIDVAWMPWPNRPFFSPAELLLVPKHSAIGMLEKYRLPLAKQPASSATPPVTLADGNPQATDLPRTNITISSGTTATWPILDAVTVPTLFAAVHDSWVDSGDTLAAKTGIYKTTHPVQQLSAYREPGRVNLNTITNDQVWDAVVSGPLASGVVISGTTATASLASNPLKNMQGILSLGTGSAGDPLRLDSNQTFTVSGTAALNVARNPMHRLYTAGRLANVATNRSNLFAIWVTLREQVPTDPDSVRYHRAFYIVDRSIPVGFEPGKDHNVRDTILLRRIIE